MRFRHVELVLIILHQIQTVGRTPSSQLSSGPTTRTSDGFPNYPPSIALIVISGGTKRGREEGSQKGKNRPFGPGSLLGTWGNP